MSEKSRSFKWILLGVVIFGAGFLLTRQRETVGVDQIGVVVSPGDLISVYQAGARPLVLPMIQRYVRITAKPVRYELTDAKSVVIERPNQQPVKIGCQVRYQVTDAAKLVATQGAETPQTAIEALILQHLKTQLGAVLQKDGASLDDVQTRVVLVGDIHQTLKQTLTPVGIEVLSFDLFSW